MRSYIERRVLEEAEYIIENASTVRSCAKKFDISKSTVWKDMTSRLCTISEKKYLEVRAVFETNLDERHIRGGEATREKYAAQKKRKNMDGM